MSRFVSALHEATHRMPGVPAHSEVAERHPSRVRHGRRLRGAHPQLQSSRGRHDTPPRILVGWQNRIARLVGARPAAPAQGEVPGGAPDSPRHR